MECPKCESDDIEFLRIEKEYYESKTDSLIQIGKFLCRYCNKAFEKELEDLFINDERIEKEDYTTDEITELYRQQLEGIWMNQKNIKPTILPFTLDERLKVMNFTDKLKEIDWDKTQ